MGGGYTGTFCVTRSLLDSLFRTSPIFRDVPKHLFADHISDWLTGFRYGTGIVLAE